MLEVAVKEVDIVEIGEEGCRVRWQFTELFLTLVNILWFEFFVIGLIYFKRATNMLWSIC